MGVSVCVERVFEDVLGCLMNGSRGIITPSCWNGMRWWTGCKGVGEQNILTFCRALIKVIDEWHKEVPSCVKTSFLRWIEAKNGRFINIIKMKIRGHFKSSEHCTLNLVINWKCFYEPSPNEAIQEELCDFPRLQWNTLLWPLSENITNLARRPKKQFSLPSLSCWIKMKTKLSLSTTQN